MHGGDSDLTGAIAGNMLGLMEPVAVLKHRWFSVVEGADLISRLVRDFLRLQNDSDLVERMSDAYPGF
jgi:ADP-ribosylglycohydrolase